MGTRCAPVSSRPRLLPPVTRRLLHRWLWKRFTVFTLLAFAAIEALVQVAHFGSFLLQFLLEFGFSQNRTRVECFVGIALCYQINVGQFTQDDRLVGKGPIILRVGKGWRVKKGGCVVHDNCYTEKRFLCPVLFAGWPKKTYGVAEYLHLLAGNLLNRQSLLYPSSRNSQELVFGGQDVR